MARTTISATYTFEAAHWLPHVPETHKCRRMHGHNFKVEVSISGGLDSRGFVLDYAELDAIVQPIIARLDHRVLNEIEGLENPTSENLAWWLLDLLEREFAQSTPVVKVWETPRYSVEARR